MVDSDGLKPETWVAIYAAIVATGALFLNIRTWFEGRPRLHLSVMIDAMIVSAASGVEEKDLIALTVTNRGKSPTVITNMVVLQMNSWWQLWAVRPLQSFVVAQPWQKRTPPNIPADLEPSKKWQGFLRPRLDAMPRLYDGTYYVGVYASHRDRPYLKRIIRRKKTALKGAKQVG